MLRARATSLCWHQLRHAGISTAVQRRVLRRQARVAASAGGQEKKTFTITTPLYYVNAGG